MESSAQRGAAKYSHVDCELHNSRGRQSQRLQCNMAALALSHGLMYEAIIIIIVVINEKPKAQECYKTCLWLHTFCDKNSSSCGNN